MSESPALPSLGMIEERTPGGSFPADSFFDVFVEIETETDGRFNLVPIHVQAVIDEIPPTNVVYEPFGPLDISLYDASGAQVGKIVDAAFVPLPPDEKFVVFVNRPYRTPTATATRTPRVTLTPTPTRPPEFYWKAGGWIDYAPSGMPDIDQKQDKWQNPPDDGPWTYCGPVAVANSLWWFDSKYEPTPVAPPAINDHYGLVRAYGSWDDHDPLNVDDPSTPPGPNGELVEDLAYRMDTDGQRSGGALLGTEVHEMAKAVQEYLGLHRLGDKYTVTLRKSPDFEWVRTEVLRSEDVVLLLGFWQLQQGGWTRIGGHYVTMAGVGWQTPVIAFSDPYWDNAEAGGPGRVLPGWHGGAHGSVMHNDVQYVSHDVYQIAATQSPAGTWGPVGYPADLEDVRLFAGQNVPAEFIERTGDFVPGITVYTEVEYALAVSPANKVWLPIILKSRVGIQQ